MSKPSSGATLDSGNALYSHLTASGSAVWALLEGSGSTSADSSGNSNTLTLGTGWVSVLAAGVALGLWTDGTTT